MRACCFLAILITLLHARWSSGLIEACGGYRWSPRGGADASRDSMSEDRNMSSRSLLVSLCLGVPASVATGAELLVPEQFASIQSAVSAAQHGDVISIAPGLHNVGDLQLPDLALSIRGRGDTANTVLSGEWIQILGGGAVRTLEHLTLRGFTGYGALHVNGASAVLVDVVVDQSQQHGIFVNTNASLTTRNCVISNNPRGAFVYVNSFWNAENCRFTNNGFSKAYGGAVGFHIGSGCNFTRCAFISNAASTGGAIGLSFPGSRVFESCYFEGNSSPSGSVWWTEFGASGTLRNSILCGHGVGDVQGGWIDGGGNQFHPEGCQELFVPEQYSTIAAAVADAQSGEVVSVAPGQYNVGDLQLPDRAISIRGRGAADATVLTGEWIQVLGGTAVRSLEQLTLRGFTGYGALHVNGAAAHLQGVVVDQNTVHGIFVNTNASLTTRDCTISGNPRGAFVYVNSFWTAEDCVFSGNGYSEAYGGAVGFHLGCGCSFTRCAFISNSASTGGAIGLSFSGSRTFDSCLFEGNTSPNGPVWWTEFGGSGVLRNSVFCGHSVGDLQGGWIDGGGNQFFPKGCATPCSSDLVADTVVNAADMAIVLNFWGTDGSQFPGVDIDGDGIVNGSDLAAVLNAWGPCPQ
jgi:aspartate 1-decarboxylase